MDKHEKVLTVNSKKHELQTTVFTKKHMQIAYNTLETLKTDTSPYVKRAVAKACGNIGDKDWTLDILDGLKLIQITRKNGC